MFYNRFFFCLFDIPPFRSLLLPNIRYQAKGRVIIYKGRSNGNRAAQGSVSWPAHPTGYTNGGERRAALGGLGALGEQVGYEQRR